MNLTEIPRILRTAKIVPRDFFSRLKKFYAEDLKMVCDNWSEMVLEVMTIIEEIFPKITENSKMEFLGPRDLFYIS